MVAYTAANAPVLTLAGEAVIDVRMPAGRLQQFSANGAIRPALYWWDAAAARWQQLPTTWDPVSRIASASVSRLGTFALSVYVHSVYLPAVSKSTIHPTLDPAPAYTIPFYFRPGR